MALIQTNPKRRKYGVAALVGVLGGIVSAIVKFGWEVPLPPRTPVRNATNPPQQLLQQLGVPEIKLWQGAAFGIVVYVGFHVILMPLMGTVPAPWDQPFAEHFSEFFGHIIWLWVIEIFRRDLRNRITHEPDAEFPLETRTN